MFRKYFQKYRLGRLYSHIPKKARDKILLRTNCFDRIGPIKIPSEISSEVAEVTLFYYSFFESKNEYFLITKNAELKFSNPLIRISSNCFYAFITNSKRCDCKWQLDHAFDLLHKQDNNNDLLIIFAVSEHGKAIDGGLRGHALLYALGQNLKQELILDAYNKNGFKPDYRNYDDIHSILESCTIRKIRLLTNNPERISYFESKNYIVERYPIEKPYDKYLSEELGVKREKLGHHLNLPGFEKGDIEVYGLSEDSFDIEK